MHPPLVYNIPVLEHQFLHIEDIYWFIFFEWTTNLVQQRFSIHYFKKRNRLTIPFLVIVYILLIISLTLIELPAYGSQDQGVNPSMLIIIPPPLVNGNGHFYFFSYFKNASPHRSENHLTFTFVSRNLHTFETDGSCMVFQELPYSG